jgi:hypothetical protein
MCFTAYSLLNFLYSSLTAPGVRWRLVETFTRTYFHTITTSFDMNHSLFETKMRVAIKISDISVNNICYPSSALIISHVNRNFYSLRLCHIFVTLSATQ